MDVVCSHFEYPNHGKSFNYAWKLWYHFLLLWWRLILAPDDKKWLFNFSDSTKWFSSHFKISFILTIFSWIKLILCFLPFSFQISNHPMPGSSQLTPLHSQKSFHSIFHPPKSRPSYSIYYFFASQSGTLLHLP